MNTELTKFAPQDFEQLMKFGEIASNTDLVPKSFKSKPFDIVIACQMGAELGLQPMQALQNIAVVNGRPCIWGDAVIAIVSSRPDCEDIKEEFNEATQTATCTVKRKNRSAVVRTFSKDDAQKAGLWTKGGVWQQYPKRMLQMRARGFACRDSFPDALRGLITAEEAGDIVEEKSVKIEPQATDIDAYTVELEEKMTEAEVSLETLLEKAQVSSLEEIHSNESLFTRCLNWLDAKIAKKGEA
jgi:hypothetical protein